MKNVYICALMCLILILGTAACSSKVPTLGMKDGMFAACTEDSDCLSSQATVAAHKVEPIKATGDPEIVMVDLQNSIESIFGSRVLAVEGTYLRAEFKSRVLRTMDDAEFYYDQNVGEIQLRFVSRGELLDLGDNRELIEEIRTRFAQK